MKHADSKKRQSQSQKSVERKRLNGRQPQEGAALQTSAHQRPNAAVPGPNVQGIKYTRKAGKQAARQPFVPGPSLPAQKLSSGKNKGSILDRMRQRLTGGRFRWLNEQMYTSEGADAQRLMQQHPAYFDEYHEGFREQTRSWPQLPVETALSWLASCPKAWRVADLGCGDAQLAARAAQRVFSYDLVARAPGVVAANMADLPLGDAAVDAAVMCLALMGTDYPAFLREAVRILKPGGILWIAEVQSRFMQESGQGSILEPFIAAVEGLGTELKFRDEKNPYFLLLRFKKKSKAAVADVELDEDEAAWPTLRACQYKKR
ncbi:hypothetical protein ACKKBF_B19210 [Auxenochlorella protothecoides x Auxenochlorella symbiontica]